MKKIIALILLAVLCLGVFAGCKPKEEDTAPTVEDAATVLHNICKELNTTVAKDFDIVGQVKVDETVFPITWASNNDAVKVVASTKAGFYTVDLPEKNDAELKFTLTATISADGKTATKSYEFTMPKVDNSGITTNPVEGVAYKLFLLQGGEGKRYYALNTTQDNNNKFVNTTTKPADGVDFYVEKVDGGYKIYTNVDGVKTYLYAQLIMESGKTNVSKYLGFSTENSSVFYYNADLGGVWMVELEYEGAKTKYGVGTYGEFTTMSLSDDYRFTTSSVGSTQYVMEFMTSEYANTLEEDTNEPVDIAPADLLNQIYALADGESITGPFQVTGVITALDDYSNPTIVIADITDKPMYCYYLSVEANVGDTITIIAQSAKNYMGTYEFINSKLVSTDSGEGSGSGSGSTGTDLPAADSTLTIEEAIALGSNYTSNEWTGSYTEGKYYVTGTITKVFNTEYGNMYITDSEGNEFCVYGTFSSDGQVAYKDMETKPVCGDVITVYGVIGAYGQTVQMSDGWVTEHTPHEHVNSSASCNVGSKCSICGLISGTGTGHTDANTDNVCDNEGCGVVLNAVPVSLAIAANTGSLSSDSLSISWASDNFNCLVEKNKSTTAIRTSDTDHFRVYANSKLTISATNGKTISKIVITATSSSYATACAQSLATAGVTATCDGSTVTLIVDLGTLESISFVASAQFRINNIEVTYQ